MSVQSDGALENHRGDCEAPLVSVIIPAFQVSQYISATLDSALTQTVSDHEIIVVNGASPDTGQLEAVLQPYLSKIHYVKDPRRGASIARNAGIRHARGKFVAFLDGDDLWMPHCLETQLQAFRQDPSLDMVYGDCVFFGDNVVAGRRAMDLLPSKGPVTLEALVTLRCSPNILGAVVRTKALLEAGLFNEGLIRCEDAELWFRMCLLGKRIGYHRKPIAYYRVRPQSSSSNSILILCHEISIQVLDALRQQPQLTDRERQAIDSQIALWQANLCLRQGKESLLVRQYEQARESLRSANSYFHRPKLTLLLLLLRLLPGLVRSLAQAWWSLLRLKGKVRVVMVSAASALGLAPRRAIPTLPSSAGPQR